MTHRLRDGSTTEDPRLDRLVDFDERSRAYPVRALLQETPPLRQRTWRCDPRLDQGSEGACVGFSWAHELNAAPRRRYANEHDARGIYLEAQRVDQWPGENYEGTSVIAGAKVIAGLGELAEYRWAFSIDDLLHAIATIGPAVLGVPWPDTAFNPGPRGHLDVTGTYVGGHAILARGIRPINGDWYVVLRNSWGPRWGNRGDALVRAHGPHGLERLLQDDGEACIPITRGTR